MHEGCSQAVNSPGGPRVIMLLRGYRRMDQRTSAVFPIQYTVPYVSIIPRRVALISDIQDYWD
jgi:hypothetical protein